MNRIIKLPLIILLIITVSGCPELYNKKWGDSVYKIRNGSWLTKTVTIDKPLTETYDVIALNSAKCYVRDVDMFNYVPSLNMAFSSTIYKDNMVGRIYPELGHANVQVKRNNQGIILLVDLKETAQSTKVIFYGPNLEELNNSVEAVTKWFNNDDTCKRLTR